MTLQLKKGVIHSMLGASLLAAASLAMADAGKAPIQLTDAQMDRIVAGNEYIFTFTLPASDSTEWFQGYSTKPAKSPGGQGTSSITTSATVISVTLSCPSEGGQGGRHSCVTGKLDDLTYANLLDKLTPTTKVVSTTTTSTVSTTGPGRSPSLKIFTNQGRM
jgi:hypothetical protein